MAATRETGEAKQDDGAAARRISMPDLVAPRRVFKRKRRKGLILGLKIALPLIAVACVAYIVVWSRQVPIVHPIDVVADVDQQKTSDVTVQRVQYNGIDANNRPYSITAETAVQPQAPAAPPADADSDGDDNPSAKKKKETAAPVP